MCYDHDATPTPTPTPARERVASAQDSSYWRVMARDGARFSAFAAHASTPGNAPIVLLPDVRGHHRFYKELATRFAEAGIDTVAMDYFGRTAGLTARDEDFDHPPHLAKTRPESIASDVAACIAYLRTATGGARRAIFAVGFCFGGSAAWMQTTAGYGLAGAIGFYGRTVDRRFEGARSPVEAASDFACPILGLFGERDDVVSVATVHQFEDALTRAGIEHELHTYPNAPHSFFDKHQTAFADASRDAWDRMLGFIHDHLPDADRA